jgi:predicted ABC-type ATPase
VKTGGHDVPTDKVSARYYRSLDLLHEAVKHTNRTYIFDNSGWLSSAPTEQFFKYDKNRQSY